MTGRFVDVLSLEEIAGDDVRVRLTEPLGYVASDGRMFVVPLGFVTDLASIPRFARSIISVWEKHRRAAVLHDYLSVTATVTSAEADRLFFEALEALEVSTWKRWVMWLAVRAASYWKALYARVSDVWHMLRCRLFKPRRRVLGLMGLPSLNTIAMIAVGVGCLICGSIVGSWWGAWGEFSRGDANGYARAMKENADKTQALNAELDAVNGELAAIEASERTSELEAREKLASVVFGENECRALDETERNALAVIGGN
jgi:hypothetical protein